MTDPWLGPLVRARPGLRAPGAWDGFELAVRAVLGQQVTLAAGRKLGSELVRLCGRAARGERGETALSHTFPTAAEVAASELGRLGMPSARRRALVHLAQATLADPLLFQPLAGLEQTVARLTAIPGIGEWTAQYIALRQMREPDAAERTQKRGAR